MMMLMLGLAFLSGATEPPAKAASEPVVGFPPASTITTQPTSKGAAAAPAEAPKSEPRAPKAKDEAPGPGAITGVVIENTGASEQTATPLTFGQVFAPGHVANGASLAARLKDGTMLPVQLDVKARHGDGSARHALISLIIPKMESGQRRRLDLVKAPPNAAAKPLTPAVLLDKGFSASVSVTIGQQEYRASADALLRKGNFSTWIAGPVASEWLVSAPLVNGAGAAHPHLSARFAIRTSGAERARVDVIVENDWAFEPSPQNFTYNARIAVGGKTVYTRESLLHYHHARWRKVVWWGEQPQLHVRHDTAYLLATRALPNYDQSVAIGDSALAALKAAWSGPKTEPMGVGLANPYMPAAGGRPDIGLLPGWAASYLLSMDRGAKDVTLGTADLAGSWSAHYRDKATGRPVSLLDFPYMTILGQRTDTVNPATKKQEAFPLCPPKDACATPYSHDAAHQPAFAYLPYLVTGDHYYLEELQFWAMWNTFMSNPAYRETTKGLVKSDQVRGQAWSLRTLAEAAYITPDADPLKRHFLHFLDANLDWYNSHYTNNPSANQLGALTHGYAIGYNGGTGLAPWMDDFFTSAVGHVAELGFPAARPLLAWKVKFPIARMSGKGACWITGAIYTLKVRDSATAPFYTSIGQAYKASQTDAFSQLPCGSADMAQSLKLKVGEMSGYAGSTTGFPANMQPALAYGADAGGEHGALAWDAFQARSVKPDYGASPQFAIVPRP